MKKAKHELLTLMNVGPAIFKDLQLLGINSISELVNADADQLFETLQAKTGHPQDPCVWDVFAAIIHEAKTGEKKPWWHWTPIRKKRQDEK